MSAAVVDEWGECRHGIAAYSCSTCLHPPAAASAASGFTADSRPFPARIDGQCPACNLPVRAGQDIVHATTGRGNGVYVHAWCAS